MANASGHRCCAICAAPPCSQKCETSGRPARREARAPAGQLKIAAPSRSAKRGTERDLYPSRSFSKRSRSSPEGPRLPAWCAKRVVRVAVRQRQNCRPLVVAPIRPVKALPNDPTRLWYQPNVGCACVARHKISCCGYAPSNGKVRGVKHSQYNGVAHE
jgi:hypothetical protein